MENLHLTTDQARALNVWLAEIMYAGLSKDTTGVAGMPQSLIEHLEDAVDSLVEQTAGLFVEVEEIPDIEL